MNWIESILQGILDTKTTTLKKVRFVNVNSMKRGFKAFTDGETITVVYRELASPAPEMGGKDRIVNGTLDIYAVESEKQIIQDVFDEFLEDNNNTLVDDAWVSFSNLNPIGAAESINSVFMQRWMISVTQLIVDSIETLLDVSVTVGTKEYTAQNGLLGFSFEKKPTYTEMPTSQYNTLTRRLVDYTLNLRVLDMDSSVLKTILYDGSDTIAVSIDDGDHSYTFTGKVDLIRKDAQLRAFATISVVIRRG